MDVRFGAMLVGPTGGGKSVCYATLQGALTWLRQEKKHPSPAFQVPDWAVKGTQCGHVCFSCTDAVDEYLGDLHKELDC
jgi:hypothetical protein